jgi:hypothetical protein
VRPSLHYYVLSLGPRTSTLFEAFRDFLIEVRNQGFPVNAPAPGPDSATGDAMTMLARTIDKCLGHYYVTDPLGLVVVGESAMQTAFRSVTAHGDSIIGAIEGDHTATAVRDLGQIVWPVVREALSGVLPETIRVLETFVESGRASSGLEAVVRRVSTGVRLTLLVEDDYHRRGSLDYLNRWPVISPQVDVRESMDDVVDTVIEKVIESGGNVVFTPGGSLGDWERIVALPRDSAGN